MNVKIFNTFLRKETFEREFVFKTKNSKANNDIKATISIDKVTKEIQKEGFFIFKYQVKSHDVDNHKVEYFSEHYCEYEIIGEIETNKLIPFLSNEMLKIAKKRMVGTYNAGAIKLEEVKGGIIGEQDFHLEENKNK